MIRALWVTHTLHQGLDLVPGAGKVGSGGRFTRMMAEREERKALGVHCYILHLRRKPDPLCKCFKNGGANELKGLNSRKSWSGLWIGCPGDRAFHHIHLSFTERPRGRKDLLALQPRCFASTSPQGPWAGRTTGGSCPLGVVSGDWEQLTLSLGTDFIPKRELIKTNKCLKMHFKPPISVDYVYKISTISISYKVG